MINIITIDGPSGAGKGTVAKLLAQKLGWHLLDSGALYRLLALAAQQQKLNLDNPQKIANLALELEIKFVNKQIFLKSQEVSLQIRSEEIGMLAAKLAAMLEVRAALLDKQREFAQEPGLIADGRDMGTVVFPQAQLKIFLTASAKERAQRRLLQLQKKGQQADFTKILADINMRDAQDTQRKNAPLMAANDAIVLDSTNLNIAQVLEFITNAAVKCRLLKIA